MNTWKKRMEAWFSAVAFAEAGEHQTALELVNTTPAMAPATENAGVIQALNTYFAAAAFAEADCANMAMEMVAGGKRKRSFLEDIGLQGVNVRYGLVPLAQDSFLENVGLGNVCVRYMTVTIP